MRKFRSRSALFLVVIVATVFLLSFQMFAVFGAPTKADCTPSGDVKRGGELRFARLEEPLTFDPTVPGDNGSIWMITQVFNTLIRVDATGTGLEPDLAESWEISDDKLTYTFHLRDAKFSNGNPV